MRGNSVKYVPEIMYISRDRVAVEGNIHNWGDIFYAIHEASGCYLLYSTSTWWRFQVESTIEKLHNALQLALHFSGHCSFVNPGKRTGDGKYYGTYRFLRLEFPRTMV